MGHQVTMQMSSQLWNEGYQIYPDTNLATHSSTQSSNESGNMRLVWEGPEGGNVLLYNIRTVFSKYILYVKHLNCKGTFKYYANFTFNYI